MSKEICGLMTISKTCMCMGFTVVPGPMYMYLPLSWYLVLYIRLFKIIEIVHCLLQLVLVKISITQQLVLSTENPAQAILEAK